MVRSSRLSLLCSCVSVAALLAGCGGGGGGGGSSPGTSSVAAPRFSTISLFAGNVAGPGNVDATVSSASFSAPQALAVDSAGNLYVADEVNTEVREISPDGVVSTLLNTDALYAAAGVNRDPSTFVTVGGIATDASGNIYVGVDAAIVKIAPGGVVALFAGLPLVTGSTDGTGTAARFGAPRGLATDSSGNVYVSDSANDTIRKITPAAVVTTLAGLAGQPGSTDGSGSTARFHYPVGITVDPVGNLYVCDGVNNTIRMITALGAVSTLAGTPGTSGSANGTGSAALFNFPNGITIDALGNLYVVDALNNTIRTIAPGAVVGTLAGTPGVFGSADGTGPAASFSEPYGVAVNPSVGLYVSDMENNTIRAVTTAGQVTTFAGVAGSAGSTNGSRLAALFSGPEGVAADSLGNVYVADTVNLTIRKITRGGSVSTLAGLTGVAGSTDGVGTAARFGRLNCSGNAECYLEGPTGIATDSQGNVYVADNGNSTIRMITPAGVVSTLAGQAGHPGSNDGVGAQALFNFPNGMATDASGDVYVADSGNNTIRMIAPGGNVTTLAGTAGVSGSADGQGGSASFNGPGGVAVDSVGNVYVVDAGNNTIRMIAPGGIVTTLAGTPGQAGDVDGVGAAARFNLYSLGLGIATDAAGNVYVADTYNNSIRKITRAGVVTTLVGTPGEYGFLAGSLPASISTPSALASTGSSLFATTNNGVVLIQ